jgi:acyl dehydratase
MPQKTQYFEDLKIGHTWASASRTITETDIVQFAGLSGDFNPLHVDEEFAKSSLFGKRIAHGLLGLSIASGLQTSEPSWLVMAFMGVEWKFTKPIFIGDTIHYESEIKRTRELSSGDRGIVFMERKLINQKGETVQEGTFTLLIKKRGEK